MNVTVKVLCQLAVFLVAFLGQGVAKQSPDYEYDSGVQYADSGLLDQDSYASEFFDDIVGHDEVFDDHPPQYYERENREDNIKRYKRNAEEEFVDKKKYDKEQYWNAEDVEVDEEPLEEIEPNPKVEDGKIKSHRPVDAEEQLDERPKTRKTRETKTRYSDHRYEEPDAIYSESRNVPRKSRGVKKTLQYEVHELAEESPLATEVREQRQAPPPVRLVHKGVKYVREPSSQHSGNFDARPMAEHYHRLSGAAGSPPAERYAEQHDQSGAASGKAHGHRHGHGKGQASGGGKDHQAKHKKVHGHKDEKGYKSVHHKDHGAKGSDGHEKHAKHYDEHGGKKHKEHDEAGHHGEHHEAAHGSKGGKFEEKKAHKKGHNTKGYHNKYHKDEYHKEHKFYDDYHKSGSHARYGDFQAKHQKSDGGHKKGGHKESSHHEDHAGKKGHHAKGHVDEDHKGRKSSAGQEKHYSHHSDHGKKGGHQGGKEHAYKQ